MVQSTEPLAYRLRPKSLDEFVGQEHIIGQNTGLRSAIERDEVHSIILAGPPGTGKTTLAHIIAQATNAQFTQLNAVTSGVKDIKEVCKEAERVLTALKQRTLLFIDEIHRFNKSQQDALLPYVESGVVSLIGATTENPYFEVNQALVSRSQVYLLQPLSLDHLVSVLQRALTDAHGYDNRIQISEPALRHIATISGGDARIALNALELAVLTIGTTMSQEQIEELFKQRSKRYDKSGEDHYNTVSAFIKSMRGSDADAALVWLFKMIESGEEPRFLFRRMAIFASEDVGNADPSALTLVLSAWQAFEFVGLPEGQFFLAHACVYLSQAPKSNAITVAMKGVQAAIQKEPTLEVPYHLRNAPMKGMRDQGYGKGYTYPHNEKAGVAASQYFPIGMQPQDFYQPKEIGMEMDIKQRMEKAKSIIRSESETGQRV